jgi:hypothetical protein
MSTKISSKRGGAAPRVERRVPAKHCYNGHSADPLQDLLDRIVERGKQIPPEELAKIPRDFAKNIDHYLYGAPKETE